jgi:adenosylhomocysteine nucleosidase
VSGRAGLTTAIVSPLAAELAGVAAAAAGLRRWRLGGGSWAARGWLDGQPVVLVATGDGARSAARGLGRLLAAERPGRLLVVGVAGGISPGLETGDLVVARQLFERRGGDLLVGPAPDAGWLAHVAAWTGERGGNGRSAGRQDGATLDPGSAGRDGGLRLDSELAESAGIAAIGAAMGSVVSGDRILVAAREKRALWDHLRRQSAPAAGMPAVCDLESAAYARLAAAAGVPWLVVRAVLDPAGEDLPMDFNLCRTGDGEVSNARVVTRALAGAFGRVRAGRPSFGALLGLRARLRLCARRLGVLAAELAGGAGGEGAGWADRPPVASQPTGARVSG